MHHLSGIFIEKVDKQIELGFGLIRFQNLSDITKLLQNMKYLIKLVKEALV
jgi:hypothetical protein